MMRRAIAVGAALLIHGPAGTQSAIVSFPLSPIAPTSSQECSALQQRYSALQRQVDDAHQTCIGQGADAHPTGTCSRAACQGLHDMRETVSRRASAAVSDCNQAVTAYLRNQAQQKAQAAREESYRAELAAKEAQRREEAARAAAEQQRARAEALSKTQAAAKSLKEGYEKARSLADSADRALGIVNAADPKKQALIEAGKKLDRERDETIAKIKAQSAAGAIKAHGDVALGANGPRDPDVDRLGALAAKGAAKVPQSNAISGKMSEIAIKSAIDINSRAMGSLGEAMNAAGGSPKAGQAPGSSYAPGFARVGAGADADLDALAQGLNGAADTIGARDRSSASRTERHLAAADVAGQIGGSIDRYDRRIEKANEAISARHAADYKLIQDVHDRIVEAQAKAYAKVARERSANPTSSGSSYSSSTSAYSSSSRSLSGSGGSTPIPGNQTDPQLAMCVAKRDAHDSCIGKCASMIKDFGFDSAKNYENQRQVNDCQAACPAECQSTSKPARGVR